MVPYIDLALHSKSKHLALQVIPADWFEHFPDVADEIQREGRKGNFISLLGRQGEDQLMRRFR